MNLRLKLAAATTFLAALPAFADVKINENLSFGGYIVGSYRVVDADPGESADRLDIDAAKAVFTGTFQPVTGVLSLYHVPGAPEDVTVLDAFATYDAGNGLTITGGKFLSYLGYEAFDPVNMTQLTYANGDFLGAIPGYHSGIKLDYSTSSWAGGVALLDSVYTPSGSYLKGDSELQDNFGVEAYFIYKGIEGLTIWTGIARDSEGGFQPDDVFVFNIWASYALSPKATIAGEWVTKDAGVAGEGYNWLALFGYSFTDKLSTIFRLSGEEIDNGPEFLRFTVAPTHKVNDNFSVRAEVSYTDYKNFIDADKALFFGVQGVFKF